ncbi:MAG: hypothetical protein AAGA92_09575 [Planctomycetota bacterium]
MMRTSVRQRLVLLLTAVAFLISPAAQAQELLATSIFAPEAGDPDPLLSGLFKIDLATGNATPFVSVGVAGLIFPSDVVVDPASDTIFVSTQLGTILHFDAAGTPLPSPILGGDPGLFAVLGAAVNSLVFDASGNLLAADSAGVISSWDPATGARNADVLTGLLEMTAIQVTPGGAVLAQSGPIFGPGMISSVENGVATPLISSTTSLLTDGGTMLFAPLDGDTDADADADVSDLLSFQRGFGSPGSADVDGSGTVDAMDLTIIEADFGSIGDLLVSDFSGNQIARFDADGTNDTVFAALPPVATIPPSNFPSELLPSDSGTLIVSTLGPTQRPDNQGEIREYDFNGNLLGVRASALPPVSGIALAPPVPLPVTAEVPEPSGALLAALALGLARGRR